MIIIAHRGLLEGSNSAIENSPSQIEKAIKEKFDVEIDIWYKDKKLYLGHDYPQYEIHLTWLRSIAPHSWIHCKNIDALLFFHQKKEFHYFWHEEDTVTITSLNYIWAYPGKQPIDGSIAVMPEIHNETTDTCIGICTDFSYEYRKRYSL